MDKVAHFTTINSGDLPTNLHITFNKDGTLLAVIESENKIKIFVTAYGIWLLNALVSYFVDIYDALRKGVINLSSSNQSFYPIMLVHWKEFVVSMTFALEKFFDKLYLEDFTRRILSDLDRVAVREVMTNEDIIHDICVIPSNSEKLPWLLKKPPDIIINNDEGELILHTDLEKHITNAMDSHQLLQFTNVLLGGISIFYESFNETPDDKEIEIVVVPTCVFLLQVTLKTLSIDRSISVLVDRTEFVSLLGRLGTFFTFDPEMLDVSLDKKDEMEYFVTGANFLLKTVHQEAFTYLDGHKKFLQINPHDLYPCLLINIGSGVSMIKVDGKDGVKT
ncbi:hypothetical protein V6N11_010631 [Hibiscus sabdariffa]|uniref:Uncharacterized protein n=1 Tax=Hibiscus sabdariffa TaxID=183260 RepID=A0ABR2S611_9ROSI